MFFNLYRADANAIHRLSSSPPGTHASRITILAFLNLPLLLWLRQRLAGFTLCPTYMTRPSTTIP